MNNGASAEEFRHTALSTALRQTLKVRAAKEYEFVQRRLATFLSHTYIYELELATKRIVQKFQDSQKKSVLFEVRELHWRARLC